MSYDLHWIPWGSYQISYAEGRFLSSRSVIKFLSGVDSNNPDTYYSDEYFLVTNKEWYDFYTDIIHKHVARNVNPDGYQDKLMPIIIDTIADHLYVWKDAE